MFFLTKKKWKHKFTLTALSFLFFTFSVYHSWLFIGLIKISSDVEENPGPKRYSAQYLTICHWNPNSIAAHNFFKVALLKAYLSVHEMDIICLSETYIVSSLPVDDDNLQISGCSSVRADHPSNMKRRRVLICYNNFLPTKLTDVKYLHESLNFELRIGGKICKFLSLYRSPSQNKDNFETFLENLELNFDHMTEKKPSMMVVLGGFNAMSKSWCTNDSTNFEDSKIDYLTSSFGFHQIINKPTHILNNSSSYIDLIFTTQTNLVMESGVHSSLHADCRHQLPYVKFIHRLMNEKCGIIILKILIAFKVQLKILIGKKNFSMLMSIKKCYFLMKLFKILYAISFLTK